MSAVCGCSGQNQTPGAVGCEQSSRSGTLVPFSAPAWRLAHPGRQGSPQVQCSRRGATGHSGHCPCPHQESSVHPHAPWGPHFHDRAPFRELTPSPPVHFGGQSGKMGTAPKLYLSGKALAARPVQDIGCGLPSLPHSATLRDGGPARLPPPPRSPGRAAGTGLHLCHRDQVGVFGSTKRRRSEAGPVPRAASFLAMSPARGSSRQSLVGVV